jgi:N6-adenosine-specific RNA methylase IME4
MSYRAIVADPPWPFKWSGGPGGRRRNPTPLAYELMTVDEIAALNVQELAGADCALFLWTTARMHREGHALRVLEAWGFRPVHEIVWRKPNFGAGVFPRIGHETCLIGRRGMAFYSAPKDVHSVQTWSQEYTTNSGKTHSAKPDGFYDLVERACPIGPYLEMFSRRARLGDWHYWGDQSLGTVELASQGPTVKR